MLYENDKNVTADLINRSRIIILPLYPNLNDKNNTNQDKTVSKEDDNRCIKYHTIKQTDSVKLNKFDIEYYHQWYGSIMNIKYNKSNYITYNLCNLPHLFFISNHKSNGYLRPFWRGFKKKCQFSTTRFYEPTVIHYGQNIYDKTMNSLQFVNDDKIANHIYYRSVTRRVRLYENEIVNDTISKYIWLQDRPLVDLLCLEYDFNIKYHQNYLIIFMVRNPLFSILSGYNYHSSGQEVVEWTNISLSTMPPRNMFDSKGLKQLIEWFKNVLMDNINDSYYVIDNYQNTTMYLEYSKGFKNNYNDTNALQYGLYLEFTRFVNAVWPLIYSMYHAIKNKTFERNVLILRSEWFSNYNFEKSILYTLQSIFGDKMFPHSLFKQLLDDRPCLRKGEYLAHTTSGKFNKTLQIELLLKYNNNDKVCLYIKNLTLLLDYQWEFNQYC